MKQSDFNRHVGLFFKVYLPSDRNLRASTIASYSATFASFLRFMKEHRSIDAQKIQLKDFTETNVRDFLRSLEEIGNCANTINQRRAAFGSFCKYLRYAAPEYMLEIDKISSIECRKFTHKAIAYMKLDGMNLFLKQIDTSTPVGLRDMTMMSLMLTAGLRVSELIGLRGRDVQLSPPVTVTVKGKGDKERIVTLPDKIVSYLRQYVEHKGALRFENLEAPLFLNHMKEKFTRQGVNYLVGKYRDMARKIDPNIIPANLSAHKLRHSCGSAAAAAGVPPIYIRDMLGHKSVVTTEVYMGTKSPEAKSEAVNKIVDSLLDGADDVKPLWENEDVLDFLDGLKSGYK